MSSCRKNLRILCLVGVVLTVATGAGVFVSAAAAAETVTLVVEFSKDKQKRFDDIAWRDGLTVLQAMNAAAKSKSGLKFKHRGSGANAFLTEIDGVENEGGKLNGKNWSYWVNDRLANRSFAVFKLDKSAVVKWKFVNR
jgi:opacity protein-like surface antigen